MYHCWKSRTSSYRHFSRATDSILDARFPVSRLRKLQTLQYHFGPSPAHHFLFAFFVFCEWFDGKRIAVKCSFTVANARKSTNWSEKSQNSMESSSFVIKSLKFGVESWYETKRFISLKFVYILQKNGYEIPKWNEKSLSLLLPNLIFLIIG